MRRFAWCFVVFLCGCVSAPPPLPGHDLVESGEVIKADHLVQFERGDFKQSLRTHLEVEHDDVVLVGLGMLGETVFECHARRENLRCDKVAAAIPAERLFGDIQHMLWSADEALRFTQDHFYEDVGAGYSLRLQLLDLKRGRYE